MYCLALELDTKTNRILFNEAQKFVKENKFYMINKFHFTLITLDNYPKENQINEVLNLGFDDIYFGNMKELEGRNTAMNYLAINLILTKDMVKKIERYRKKYMEEDYFPLIPHISLLQTEDEFIQSDIEELDRSFNKNQELGFKSLLVYGPDRNIIKKIPL